MVSIYIVINCRKTLVGKTYRVDGINILPAFAPHARYPVPIEVVEQSFNIIGFLNVVFPFLGVVLYQCFILERL